MDFKKIARIFIVAFGLLNLYLIYGILERQDIQDSSQQPTNYNILTNMEEMDIELPNLEGMELDEETEIYSIQANAHNLMAKEIEENDQYTGILNDQGVYYVSFPSNPVALEGNPVDGFTQSDYQTVRELILSDQVMFGSEYSGILYDASGRRFVAYQYVDNIPIIDGTSEISFFVNDEGEIYSYQQTYAGPVTRQGNALNLISGTRAIEILFINNEIREGSEVLQPVLAYNRALHLEDLSMYSPVWIVDVIRASEKNTFRVDAVNGTIIRQPVTPPEPSRQDPADLEIEEDGPNGETDEENQEEAAEGE